MASFYAFHRVSASYGYAASAILPHHGAKAISLGLRVFALGTLDLLTPCRGPSAALQSGRQNLGLSLLDVVRNSPKLDRAFRQIVHEVGGSRVPITRFANAAYVHEMSTGLPVKAFPILPTDLRYWDDHQIMLKINKIIAKACAYDMRERYESAKPMLNDLEGIR